MQILDAEWAGSLMRSMVLDLASSKNEEASLFDVLECVRHGH